GTNQYRYWSDLFSTYGVNLALESDSHLVKTTWPIRPDSGAKNDSGFIQSTQGSTVYIGEGGWGAPLKPMNDAKSWTRDAASFNHFFWIFVDSAKIEIRTINVENGAEVGQVSDTNLFQAPPRLNIWTPQNGSVLTISQ